MMVSSQEQLLSIPEILQTSIEEQKIPKNMVMPSMLALVKEATMPDTDVRQFGNTVFISHFKEKNGLKVVYGRALNADTAENFLKNGEEYFEYLIDEGVNYFITQYVDPRFQTIFRYIQRPDVQARVGGTARVETRKTKNGFLSVVKIEAA